MQFPISTLDSLKEHPDLHFITDADRLNALCTDWRGHFHGKTSLAVEPKNVNGLQVLLAHCHQHGIPVVPQGGNTGLCGGATPDHSGSQLVISLRRLRAIRDIDQLNASMTVEAGCTLEEIQNEAEKAGFLFPLSLAAQGTCQIGGNLATNAGGVHVVRYGMMRDLILGLEVVLPDGRLWSGLRKLKKDNTGYSLKHLFVGSEGTLGIITAATLKMMPRWADVLGVWISVDTLAEIDELLGLFRKAAGDRLCAFEVMSSESLQWVKTSHPDWVFPSPLKKWTAWIELAETAPHSSLLQWFEDHLELFANWADSMQLMQTAREHEQGWRWRENIPTSEKSIVHAYNYDISVPISQLTAWVNSMGALIHGHFPNVQTTCFGHWGDGNLHWGVYVPKETSPEYLNSIKEPLTTLIFDHVHAYQGSISAEHGLGQLKVTTINHYQDAVERDLMRQIKKALDPANLMNPGKVVDM
ncbi:MAG: FAD-binding oxidoreductase [Pseudomonadota bacterium]